MKMRQLLIAALGLAVAAGAASGASAETNWQRTHPARAEVNHRVHYLNRTIRAERRAGEISAPEARRLHREDRRIERQQHFFAARHGGHLSRAERAQLNREAGRVQAKVGK